MYIIVQYVWKKDNVLYCMIFHSSTSTEKHSQRWLAIDASKCRSLSCQPGWRTSGRGSCNDLVNSQMSRWRCSRRKPVLVRKSSGKGCHRRPSFSCQFLGWTQWNHTYGMLWHSFGPLVCRHFLASGRLGRSGTIWKSALMTCFWSLFYSLSLEATCRTNFFFLNRDQSRLWSWWRWRWRWWGWGWRG